MDLSVVPYLERSRGEAEGGGSPAKTSPVSGVRGGAYRECMRNHAAAIGGQAYDGCGEFMPGGEEGSLEALKCAACGCHRNFHRRDGGLLARAGYPRRPIVLYNPAAVGWDKKGPIPAPPLPPAGFPPFLPPPLPYHAIPPPLRPAESAGFPEGADRGREGSETPPRREEAEAAALAEGSRLGRKRFRTKFTAEQKEKMREFAEKLGWRIQKHDDAELEEFCVEIGVKRHVLKVWMHNNKSHLASTSESPSASAAVEDAAASAASHDGASAQPIRV